MILFNLLNCVSHYLLRSIFNICIPLARGLMPICWNVVDEVRDQFVDGVCHQNIIVIHIFWIFRFLTRDVTYVFLLATE